VSNRVQKLATYQDLELMIQEAKDPALIGQEKSLGFDVAGLDQLQARLDALAAEISKQDFRNYQRVRRNFDRAVVLVIDKICHGCFQTLPTSRTRVVQEDGPLPICESCGRILLWL
jgi:predicted  nucleic acid-binding Zn-ribbon protein